MQITLFIQIAKLKKKKKKCLLEDLKPQSHNFLIHTTRHSHYIILSCVSLTTTTELIMEALKASSFPSFHRRRQQPPISTTNILFQFQTPTLRIPLSHKSNSKFVIQSSSSSSSVVAIESDEKEEEEEEEVKFDWYDHWYPVWPVCDLDKRRPHAKKVIGIDVVVWWDRNDNAWKVFEDSCPHRLAPLSEGRIDQWGRLQCVYHGWCFGGAGDCKFIPQAPRDGPPVYTYYSSISFLNVFVSIFSVISWDNKNSFLIKLVYFPLKYK